MGKAARWLRALFGWRKPPPPAAATVPKPSAKERKRWGGFVKSFRENDKTIETAAANTAAPYDDEEQNKRAIAVAAATAALADAAVAAAHAAAAVVRLTSRGREGFGCGKRAAVVKIQAAFRAYLARRAFRALKGLVKLQAIVRGNIVRKQAAETLRCMQALVRVQARARACRALRSSTMGPSAPEKSDQSVLSNNRKKTPSKQTSSGGLDQDRSQSSSGYRWLDHWMEECYCDTANSEMIPLDDEKNAKILEIDTGKPRYYNPKRKTNNFTSVSESPSKDSTIIDAQQQTPSPLRFQPVGGCDLEESPRFFSVSSRPTGSRRGPFTPTKSECSRSLFSGYSDYPSYMANTESSRAKVRAQSAPKQRPELEKLGSTKRGGGGGGGGGHGLGQQSQGSYKAYPGSGRLDRLGMPIRN